MFSLSYLYVLFIIQLTCGQNLPEIPQVLVEVLKPRGVRFSIPDVPGLSTFTVRAFILKNLRPGDVRVVNGAVASSKNGRWSYEDRKELVKPGDVINYRCIASFNGVDILIGEMSYVVPDVPGLSTFTVRAFILKNLRPGDVRVVNGAVASSKNGRWSYEDRKELVKPGDVINYRCIASFNGVDILIGEMSYVVPDVPGIGIFGVQANINRRIGSNDVGVLTGEVTSSKNGQWSYEDRNVEVKPGDVINYYVFVSVNGKGYLKDNLSYVVSEFAEDTTVHGDCNIGITTVHREPVCVGKTIFLDNFDTDTLSTDAWRIEHKIAFDHPEYPFISYQRSAISVRDGHLYIEPSLQQNKSSFDEDSIFTGNLDLTSWCTGPPMTCQMRASGINILPPVVSGRVTSKTLSFRYGVVEIRAKLPLGDWLYPEILLEPFSYQYGTAEYASGLFKMATARGNLELLAADTEIGNQVLYGGPIIEKQCRDALLSTNMENRKRWGDTFHTYAMRWTPDHIILSVDNEEWARIEPKTTLLRELPPSCQSSAKRFAAGSKMAPFDQEFVLSLGVAAGGVTEFPDTVPSKPWRNSASKAKLHFWQHLNSWYPTWRDQSSLVVDYVKVTAL